MIVLYILAFIVVVLWIGSTGPLIGYAIDYGIEDLEGFFDPVVRYDTEEFNLFGVITITILLNIAFTPMAIVFWLYKLCTIGRR